MELYLSLRDRSRFEERILFDPTEPPRCATLRDLYISVVESIGRFESQVSNTQSDFQICQELHGRLRALEAAVRKLYSEQAMHPGLTAADFNACKIAVDIDTGRLMVDGQDVGELDAEVLLARLSREEASFGPVTDFDFAELGHAEGRTFLCRASGFVLIALAGTPIIAAWQAVEKRHKMYDAGKLSPDLIATSDSSWEEIRCSPFFADAREIVMANLGLIDSGCAEARLISWLRLFKPPYPLLLLEVIAAHYCVKEQDVQDLLARVANLYRDGDIVLTVKEFADSGGIHRILATREPGLARSLGVTRPVPKIVRLGNGAAQEAAKPRLIVPHDVGISGKQVARAFRYYLADEVDERRQEWAVGNFYHLVPADTLKDFRMGMSRFSEVHFVFGCYTGDAETMIRKELTSHYLKESVKFHGSVVCDGSYKLGQAHHLNAMQREKFAELVRDKSLLEDIFEISPDEEEQLAKERRDTDQINLMVRVESVPKRAAQLFTLRPRKADVEPLFKRIAEHPRRA